MRVRLFIAIPLPPDLKANLSAIQQEFRQLPLQARRVREAGLHLTLRFFGEVDRKRIESIISCMAETSQAYPPISLEIK